MKEHVEMKLVQKEVKEVTRQGKLQDTVDSISIVDVQLPQFTQRNLLQFEMVFMTEPQVNNCVQMFEGKVKSSNPIYLSWKALKTASLPSEEEALAMGRWHTLAMGKMFAWQL